MLCIKYIAFAHYPPRSNTSQDGGLVGLYESQKLHVLFLNTDGLLYSNDMLLASGV
jgi:hypothetical protein